MSDWMAFGSGFSTVTWLLILLTMQVMATVLLVVLMSWGRIGPSHWPGEDGFYAEVEDDTE